MDKYRFDDEAAELAQEIMKSPKLKALYNIARDMNPKDLKAAYSYLIELKGDAGSGAQEG